MRVVTVTTKTELEAAKDAGYEQIIVNGGLADKLKQAKKIATAGTVTLALLTSALAAMPFTGGLSAAAAIPIAALTGFEIAAILVAASLGLGLIIAIFKGYEEVSYEAGRLVIKKRQS